MEPHQIRYYATNEDALNETLARLSSRERQELIDEIACFCLKQAQVDATGRKIPLDSRARQERYFNNRFNMRMQTGAYCSNRRK